MTRYKLSRKQQKDLKQFKARAKKDIAYFLFCGVVFYGVVTSATPTINKFFSSATSIATAPLHNTTKAYSMALAPSVEPKALEQAETWDDFKRSAEEIAPIYNFPVQLLLAQAAHESNRGLSHYAQVRNNYFGMGCYDWDPDGNCIWYENEKQSIISYILNIRETFPEAWAVRDNPEEMLRMLQGNSRGVRYATDPNYVTKVLNTPEWRSY